MEVKKVKFRIPRKKSTSVSCRIEGLNRKDQIPLEEVLVKVIARIYHERRHLTDEPA